GKRETAAVQLVLNFVPQGGLSKGLLDALFPVSLVTVQLQAKGHVPENAHGKRIWLLKYHADMAADSHRVDFGIVYIRALKVYVSFKAEPSHQVVHPVQAPQHCALAAPGRPYEGRDLAALDRDAGISYGFELTVEQLFYVAVDNYAIAFTGRRWKVLGRFIHDRYLLFLLRRLFHLEDLCIEKAFSLRRLFIEKAFHREDFSLRRRPCHDRPIVFPLRR